MALSQFGGRPGSGGTGSASSGKEIGEVFLVPQTYNSSDVVDAGETIINADYPLLYPKLVNGSVTNNFVTRTWALSDGAITNVRHAATAHHSGATYMVTWDGKVASTNDGSTWTARGVVASPSDANFNLMWSPSIASATNTKPLVAMYSTGSRLVIINYNCRYCAGFYTDDDGVTWNTFNDATVNAVLAVSTSAIGFVGTAGAAILVDVITKKIWRSTNGISGWTDVTGATVIPASTATPTMYSDDSTTYFWVANTSFVSTNNGATWTSSAFTAGAPSTIVRWNSTLYCLLYTGGAQPCYKSTDNGTTWVANGTITTTSGTWSLLVPGSDGNIGAVSLTNVYKSTDGTVFTSTGGVSPVTGGTTNHVFPFLVKNAGTGYTAVFPGNSGGAVRTTSGSYGAPWTIANPIWFTGVDIPGIWAVDSATNTAGTTVIPCVPWTAEGGRGAQGHGTSLNVTYCAQTNVAYVGNWTTGFQVVTLPVVDVWHGITWNAAAGLFLLTGGLTDAVYTSPDGLTWTTVPLGGGNLPQSAKLCTPRTAGPVTYFIPYAAGTLNLMMFVVRPDGTSYYLRTPYTRTNWGLTFADNAIEILDGAVSTGTSVSNGWLVDPRLLTSSVSAGVVPTSPTTWLPTTGYAVGHKNIAVGRPNTAGNISTAVFADKFATIPPTVNTFTTTENVRPAALMYKDGVLYLYYSTKVVRTSTDFGANWTAASALTSISSDESNISLGKTFGDGIVVLFGNRGTYIYDSTATGTDPTSKTLNNGWVAPTGLKYVVKAK